MAGRIQIKLITLLIFTLFFTQIVYAIEESYILASYSFDDNNISTGPDTFTVFERGNGIVKLTPWFKFSGYSAVAIRDVPGDRDFPELQGYFKHQKEGILYAHFALMVTDPNEVLNIALAGPEWFTLKKDGIGFWLNTKNGFLYHVTDSIPKKLFSMKSFVWYLVDVTYDVDNGTYDLLIHEEYINEPVVSVEKQKNASNNLGSSIDKFSFIGDRGEDTSRVIYFVDDIVIGTDEQIVQLPFVAPGRRKLFVDSWDELQYRLRQSPGCIPAVSFADFGISASDLKQQKNDGAYYLLSKILVNDLKQSEYEELTRKMSGNTSRVFNAVLEWNRGCELLSKGENSEALEKFNYAYNTVPRGKIFALSRIQALSALKEWDEVDDSINYSYNDWSDDTRFAILQAIVGLSKGDLDSAEAWLEEPAVKFNVDFGDDLPDSLIKRIWAYEIDRDVLNTLSKYDPVRWQGYLERALIAEQYYYVLLWKGLYEDARQYAELISKRLEFLGAPNSKWQERSGDASFFLGDYERARLSYEKSLNESADKTNSLLKLSDVYFVLNNTEKEKYYREQIYGSLTN